MASLTVKANYIDLFERKIFPASVEVVKGEITSITPIEGELSQYILPGFIDAHVHIESSMLVPTEFARLAVTHGTVATISDPHEIANVCGMEGVDFMISNSKKTPFKIFFGAPSCVPATTFETAGAVLDSNAIEELLAREDIWYLAEMMNYPGVLNKEREVMAKLAAAKKNNKPVDGHAPGLKGKLAEQYGDSGITTDHESFTLEEALDKVQYGMYCLIREGSAAKNFDALIDLIRRKPYSVMFCSDDKHPDELVLHHINNHVKRALKKGYNLFDVLRAACVHPVIHYDLPVGLLRKNDPADFIIINDLENFDVAATYINGELVAENGVSLLPRVEVKVINNFSAEKINVEQLRIECSLPNVQIRVIEAVEGQLITNEIILPGKIEIGFLVSDIDSDILKIVVVNRYEQNSKPPVAFIKNFGLKTGAIASTIAHDCHNIIAVGTDDESICKAINALIEEKGGIAVVSKDREVDLLPLPIAGIMSNEDGYIVAEKYTLLDKKAKLLGSKLQSPFMTLSFMALLVIPSLKLSDKGLFDGEEFKFTKVIV